MVAETTLTDGGGVYRTERMLRMGKMGLVEGNKKGRIGVRFIFLFAFFY